MYEVDKAVDVGELGHLGCCGNAGDLCGRRSTISEADRFALADETGRDRYAAVGQTAGDIGSELADDFAGSSAADGTRQPSTRSREAVS